MDSTACNYNPEANMADDSCTYPEQGYDCDGNITAQIGDEIEGGYLFYLDESDSRGLVAAIEDLETTYKWGCYGTELSGADETAIGTGYQNTLDIVSGCSETPIAASEALAYESNGYYDWFLPSKNELITMCQNIWQPDNSFTNFINERYWSSSKFTTLNSWLVQFQSGTEGHTETHASARYNVRPIRAFGNWTMGCIDSLACNYNPEANMADASCEYSELGYDCEGNISEYVIGMQAEGGIVFYVDETGQHGLVAAMEDLEGSYEWGCEGVDINGADGHSIGTGLQNTLDIVAGCSETPIAASVALTYVNEGYSDWYLPSRYELAEMYNTIRDCCYDDNIEGWGSLWHWSSSESNYTNSPWNFSFHYNLEDINYKNNTYRVRVIRDF
jgi:hypothetical protein